MLPLTMLLLVLLAVSSISFLHLDFLERRAAFNSNDKLDAFYLANSGIERAREVFKISPTLDWSNFLDGTNPDFPPDNSPNNPLCPDDANPDRGCVTPSFEAGGSPMTSANAFNFPFSSTFDRGSYSVRAFNDEAGTMDTNGVITLRALGIVGGEQKLIQVDIVATSDMDLINCQQGASTLCPDPTGNSITYDNLDGRDRSFKPELPTLISPLTDANGYYRKTSGADSVVTDLGIPAANVHSSLVGNITLISGTPNLPDEVHADTDSYYYASGNITVKADLDRVVIVSGGDVDLQGVKLTHAIVAGVGTISLKNFTTVNTPDKNLVPYPAIIGVTGVSNANNAVTVYGNIFSSGTIDLRPVTIVGIIIGNVVNVQGDGAFSDGSPSNPNPGFYEMMKGFHYPEATITTAVVSGKWQEIQ